MGTKAQLHANDWMIKFIAGGDVVVDVWQGRDAKEALDNFQAEVFGPPDNPNEWYDFHTGGNSVMRVRTGFIGALEAYR